MGYVERRANRTLLIVSIAHNHRKQAHRRLPPGARYAARTLAGADRVARDRFSRTFAAVLAECYGGSWTVKWTEGEGDRRKP